MPFSAMNSRTGRLVIDTGCMYNFIDCLPMFLHPDSNPSLTARFRYHVDRSRPLHPGRWRCQNGANRYVHPLRSRPAPFGRALKGFGLRVGTNRATFIVLVTSGRRKSIGVWPHQSLAEARRDERLWREKTLAAPHPPHTAFDDALKAYLSEAERTCSPLTY